MGVFEFVIALVAMILGAVSFWVSALRKDRSTVKLDPEANYDRDELSAMAQSLKQRIDILEEILDAEIPDWRVQNEQRSQ